MPRMLLTALALGGCDTDSPTAPSVPPPAAAPGSSPASVSWSITVTASPNSFDATELAQSGFTSTISITAVRADNGQPVPQNSTAVLTTTAGALASGSSSGTSIPITFGSGGRAIATLTPPLQPGTVVVQAQLESSLGQATVQILETPLETPLFIQGVTPNSGPPGGTRVRIEGSGFDAPVRVTFGGLNANVVSVSSNLIIADTPPVTLPVGDVLSVAISVSINVNEPEEPQATDVLSNAFTYAREGQTQVPLIVSVTPSSGPNEGGTQVTVLGENFADEVQVFFGTATLIEAPVLSVAPTRLLIETPSATGPNSSNRNAIVHVRVVNVDSGLSAQLNGAFQYGGPGGFIQITAAGPGEGTYLGGTIVEIFGTGFDEPVAVSYGGFGQQVISVTGTEIVSRSIGPIDIEGCSPVAGAFGVTNIETGETADSALSFTYEPVEPAIFSITPNEIGIDDERNVVPAGATATISGAGFDFPLRVTFGTDAAASIVAGSVVLDPAFDPRFGIGSAFDVVIPRLLENLETEACTDADGNTGTRPVPTRVDVMVENLPTECTDTFTSSFTYVPADASCEIPPPDPLVADFSAEFIGETRVVFTNTSTGGEQPYTASWDFDDDNAAPPDPAPDPSTSSAADLVVVEYASAAKTYVVRLTVNSPTTGESDTIRKAVTVTPTVVVEPLAASFSFAINNLTVTFADTSTGDPTNFSWDFGDGDLSIEQNPVHTYPPVAADYEVTLLVSTPDGSDSVTMTVSILPSE